MAIGLDGFTPRHEEEVEQADTVRGKDSTTRRVRRTEEETQSKARQLLDGGRARAA